ncbi:hypothetical protein D3C79_860810 [compost metagenome]
MLLLALIGEPRDGQVEFFFFEHFHQVVTGLLHHLDRQQWPAFLDLQNGLGQGNSGGGENTADPEVAVTAFAQTADLFDERARVIQGNLRIAQHMLTQRGGWHAPWQAFEQSKAQQAFDFLEHLAEGRLTEIHLLRRQVHVTCAPQRVDQLQMPEFEPSAKVGE